MIDLTSILNYMIKTLEQNLCVEVHFKSFADCDDNRPSETGNLMIESESSDFGPPTITFRCKDGYTMQGSPDVTCMYGNWSKVPQCIGEHITLYVHEEITLHQ